MIRGNQKMHGFLLPDHFMPFINKVSNEIVLKSKKQIAKRVVFEFVFRQDIADQAVVYQRLYSCRSLWEFRETLRNIEIYNPTRDQRAAIDDALVKAFDAVTVALGVVLSLIKPTNDSTGEISDDENSLQFPASEEKMLSVD